MTAEFAGRPGWMAGPGTDTGAASQEEEWEQSPRGSPEPSPLTHVRRQVSFLAGKEPWEAGS